MVRKSSVPKTSRPPIEVGGVRLESGTTGRVDIPVARLATGTWLSLPVSVIHGRRPGPTIWLSGTIHGDELNGIAIIREVVRGIRAKELAGTILAVPIVNVFGLMIQSRYLPDRRDLNRSFPGSKRGSLAARLAHLLVNEIVRHCDYGIDYHTGSNGRANLPQIRCNIDDGPTRELAEVFCPPLVMSSRQRSGSLRDTAVKMGITALLFEAGAAHYFDRSAIRIGVKGTQRILKHIGMVDYDAPLCAEPPPTSRKSAWARARRGGLCQMSVELGETVVKDQELAVVFESLGTKDSIVRSPSDGLVVGQLDHAMVNLGDAIAHVAELGA